jgi:hypothetical protein
MQLQSHYKMRTIEKETITDWEEFCSEIKVEEADSIEEVLEDIKEEYLGETEEDCELDGEPRLAHSRDENGEPRQPR